MSRFYSAASIHDLIPGKGLIVQIKGKKIALFLYNNHVYAIQNQCPHQNADLAAGYIKGGKIYCSLHHWAFDIATGAYALNPAMHLVTYETRVDHGIVSIKV